MTEFDSAALESAATAERIDVDKRDVRALTECHTVLPIGGGIYEVVSESGSSYRVDAREGRCTCPDHQYREVHCKHLRRVNYATGETPIPAWADADAVDPLLGEHVDGTPQVARAVAADGGTVVTDDDGDAPAAEERPDDCGCTPQMDGLPCFPCFREGFETVNPEATDD